MDEVITILALAEHPFVPVTVAVYDPGMLMVALALEPRPDDQT
jgi:hypothetical protein